MRKLGGWWRIWIVATAGLLAYAIYYSSWNNDLELDGKPSLACIPGTAESGTRFDSVWVKNPHYRPDYRPPNSHTKLPSLDELLDSSGRQAEPVTPKSYEEELARRVAAENAYKAGEPLDRYFEEEKNGFPSQKMIEKKTPISVYRCVSWMRVTDNLGYVAILSIFLIFAARIAKWIVEGFNK